MSGFHAVACFGAPNTLCNFAGGAHATMQACSVFSAGHLWIHAPVCLVAPSTECTSRAGCQCTTKSCSLWNTDNLHARGHEAMHTNWRTLQMRHVHDENTPPVSCWRDRHSSQEAMEWHVQRSQLNFHRWKGMRMHDESIQPVYCWHDDHQIVVKFMQQHASVLFPHTVYSSNGTRMLDESMQPI